MLYRKTTTAFSAVILGVMALLGATAHAQIDLDRAGTATDRIAVAVFSKESLPYLAARQTHYTVRAHSASQGLLDVGFELSRPIPMGTGNGTTGLGGMAVRLDLTNLQFNAALGEGNMWVQLGNDNLVTRGDAQVRLAAGGTTTPGSDARCNGRTCAIYEVGATADVPDTADVWFGLGGGQLGVVEDGGGQFRARLYTSYSAAIAGGGTGLLKDTGSKTGVHVASSVTTRVTGGTAAVADVAATPRFTNFDPAGTRPLGGITITLNTSHALADGTGAVSSLDDVRPAANGGNIMFTDTTESLAFATFSLRGPSTATAPCPAAGALPVTVPAMGDNAGRGSAALFVGARTLCVSPRRSVATVPTSPNLEIPATTITAAVNFNARSGRQFAPAGMMGTVGTIVRNGATVQISYLTVSDRYNQRIIITNRTMSPAEYELSNFYTEDGTEGMAGETASGMIPATSSVVVLTRDAVTFTGSRSRGSATLAVTAPAGMVSVATTQVNLSDGSTDTVNYEVTGAGAN